VLRKTAQHGTVHHYSVVHTTATDIFLPGGGGASYDAVARCYFVPQNAWSLYDLENRTLRQLEIQWLDGAEHDAFHLNSDEIIIQRSLYELFAMDQQESPALVLRFGDWLPGTADSYLQMRVVGVVDLPEYRTNVTDPLAQYRWPTVFLPMTALDSVPAYSENPSSFQWYEVIYTDAPEYAISTAESLDIICYSVLTVQNEATQQIILTNTTKAMIAAAMVVLLGICLYACFMNALSERRFEIGVKRAIGASGWSIVRQFLYESLLVMTGDILISVALVANIAIICKFVLAQIPEQVRLYGAYTIYISPYSMGMFGLCALGITVVFSLIFAYRSTQVQIVDYLKAE